MEHLSLELERRLVILLQECGFINFHSFSGYDTDSLYLSAVLRGDASVSTYTGMTVGGKRVTRECSKKIVEVVEEYLRKGLRTYSYHSALFFIWFRSPQRQIDLQNRKKEEELDRAFKEALFMVSCDKRFGFQRLYDALSVLSMHRGAVLRPEKKKDWGKRFRTFYKAKDLTIKISNSPNNLVASWMVCASIKDIQSNIWASMKFAKENSLTNLSKVLYQIKIMNIDDIKIERNSHEIDRLAKLVAPLKRLSASIDDLLVHIIRKTMPIDYSCVQTVKSVDFSFRCRSHMGNEKFCFLGCGERTDHPSQTRAFHTLFKHERFDLLVNDLKVFKKQVG